MGKTIKKAVVGIKYPRVMTSGKRHAILAKEAKLRKMSIQDVAEERFAATDQK